MTITNHYGSRTELSRDFILTPTQYYAFEKFENSFPYPIKHDKNTDKFTIGFREFNQTETFASHLFSNNMDLSHKILFRAMDTTYREFETYLSTVVERNLKNVTLNSLFERVYGVFQLKETYELFSDIDYYELCYSTNFTASGYAYYLFRFYLEDIEPSCVLEDKKSESIFQYQTDKQEAVRPKIIISTHYKNMKAINRLFLSNYKIELAKKFECSIEDVNDDMMDLFDMIVI
jgi:hypothetical protein